MNVLDKKYILEINETELDFILKCIDEAYSDFNGGVYAGNDINNELFTPNGLEIHAHIDNFLTSLKNSEI